MEKIIAKGHYNATGIYAKALNNREWRISMDSPIDIESILKANKNVFMLGYEKDRFYYAETWITLNENIKYFHKFKNGGVVYYYLKPEIVNGELSVVKDERFTFANIYTLLQFPCTNMARLMQHRVNTQLEMVTALIPKTESITIVFLHGSIELDWKDFDKYLHFTRISKDERCIVNLRNMNDFNCGTNKCSIDIPFQLVRCPLWKYQLKESRKRYGFYFDTYKFFTTDFKSILIELKR